MNKWVRALLIFLGIIVVAFGVARITGGLVWYTMPTASNEPTLPTGSTVAASSFKSPKRGNFIVYKNAETDSAASLGLDEKRHGDLYIKRLCGIPGDVIEMKNGDLYVNNNYFDADYTFYHDYYIPAKELDFFEEADMPSADQTRTNMAVDSIMVPMSTLLYNKYKDRIHFKKYIASDKTVWSQSGDERNNWTIDNFGPITVPEGYYLALGDNRHNSLDSRYIGFIRKSDCKATVLFK